MRHDTDPGSPLLFACGAAMPNRFMLAPMTNRQSHPDGSLSDEEHRWLTKRAAGRFGMVMTCASHVQPNGRGWAGQLGIFSDHLLDGHRRLAADVRSYGALSIVQLHHAGLRAPKDLIDGPPVSASDHAASGARALTTDEVHDLRDDFITAAVRAQRAGHDGVEVHGAHGYILTQFLSAETNRRSDEYGGSPQDRARLLHDIMDGIRSACGPAFVLGVRLSPEKFGLHPDDILDVCRRLIDDGRTDFLDISLWDYTKCPADPAHGSEPLLDRFVRLPRSDVRLAVAGGIRSAADVRAVLDAGVDFASIGRSAILHHDFPVRVLRDPDFRPVETPVSAEHLRTEGLSDIFIDYMRRWPDFVVEE